MRFDKQKAFELRRQGKSYKEIRSVLGMSLAILSDWFKNEDWSKKIKSRLVSAASTRNSYKLDLMHKARKKQLDSLYEKAREEAKSEYRTFSSNHLFIAGLMIYWGEGDKLSKYRCGIANTEPRMLKVFSRFLQEIAGINPKKIKIWLLLYPDLVDANCKKYWVEACGLPEANFSKSITVQGKSAIRRLNYGVCSMAIYNRYFKEKMLTWLELASKELSG
ncbi:MAG: hypothetical protein Q7R93_04150 [bacterium]|nr:hypothetical protein [bacterium]